MASSLAASNAEPPIGSKSIKASQTSKPLAGAPRTRRTTCGHAPSRSTTGRRGLCDRCRGIGYVLTRLSQAQKGARELLGLELGVPDRAKLLAELDSLREGTQPTVPSPARVQSAPTDTTPQPPLPPATRSPGLPHATPDQSRPPEAYERIGGEPGWMDRNRW
jgi:hypothetical protein